MQAEWGALRIAGVERGTAVRFLFDDRPVSAHAGESVAAALYASGIRTLRSSPQDGAPRGMFCLMGSCQECLVWVGARKLPSCQVSVSEGLCVHTLAFREAAHG